MKEYPYLYLGSSSEAKRYNELDRWRESHRENIACKHSIESAIKLGFDGMHLDENCARTVIAEHGFKRVGWVLANTIQHKDYDGRFSLANKEWAKSTYIPFSDSNRNFVVESHPAVLDGFVNEFRAALDEFQLFDQTHCETPTEQDFTGKVLALSPMALKESYWSQENQLWYATGGFGCSPTAAGRAVYATCLGDGEITRWDRSDFIGPVKDEHLPDWAREQVEKIRNGQEIGPISSDPTQVMTL